MTADEFRDARVARATEVRVFYCDRCGKKYTVPQSYSKHRRVIHDIHGARSRAKSLENVAGSVERLRATVVRGNNMDSQELWMLIGDRWFGKKRGVA